MTGLCIFYKQYKDTNIFLNIKYINLIFIKIKLFFLSLLSLLEKHVSKSPGKEVINQIYRTLNHFFPDLSGLLRQLPDSRQRKVYQTEEITMAGINLFLFKQGSRNAFNNDRKELQFLKNYQKLFNMNLPHLDTTDDFFRVLPEEELEKVKASLISHLIRSKIISGEKFHGYYVVAVDGTGLASFNEKHCEGCLRKTSKNGVLTYFHNVLEAKLLTPSGFSLSIATEWITNQGKDEYQKQDCEREAFKRIAKKLKSYTRVFP